MVNLIFLQEFYMYVLFITIAILGGYLICCVYNLLWLTFPCMASLHRVMKRSGI